MTTIVKEIRREKTELAELLHRNLVDESEGCKIKMENYVNKIALVTGASSGIGAGLAKELVKHGCIVIGIARRLDKLQVRSEV